MKTIHCPWFGALATLALLIFFQSSAAHAQGTAFSYQGQLSASGTPANGGYDMSFTLYTTNVTGVPIAGPVTNTAVAVSNGLFSTTIDFGNVYSGQSNWLEIAVSTNGANAFTTLAPRQQLDPVPYAITAANLSGMVSSTQLPSSVITNGASGINVSGTFTGNGSGITNVPGTLPQTVTSGTSISAQPNTAYNLTSSSLVTVSLPSSADVGDVVQVNGTGSGGWQADAQGGAISTGLAGSSQEFQYLGNEVWQPLTPSFGDNGQELINLNASQLTSGTVPLAQLPAVVVTNNETGVTLSGTFSGNGSGLTRLPSNVITNTETGITLSGTFSGNLVTNNQTGVTLSGVFNGANLQSNIGSTGNYTPINGFGDFVTTTNYGYYAEIGNQVYFEDWVIWIDKSGTASGNLVLSLPPVPVVSYRAAFDIGYSSGITASGQLIAITSKSGSSITISVYTGFGVSNVPVANCGGSGELQITGVYRWQ
jgi:hypothetical protein